MATFIPKVSGSRSAGASANVTDETLRHHILGALKKSPQTVEQLTVLVYGGGSGSGGFQEEVANQGRILATLLKLKHEHRAWPLADSRWEITSKGTRDYG